MRKQINGNISFFFRQDSSLFVRLGLMFFVLNFLQVQVKQEPKPAAPVTPLPSTAASIQISQVHSGAPAVAASTALPVKIKTEKIDRCESMISILMLIITPFVTG